MLLSGSHEKEPRGGGVGGGGGVSGGAERTGWGGVGEIQEENQNINDNQKDMLEFPCGLVVKDLTSLAGVQSLAQELLNDTGMAKKKKKKTCQYLNIQSDKIPRKVIFTQLHLPSFHIYLMKNEMESSHKFTDQRFFWYKFYLLVLRLKSTKLHYCIIFSHITLTSGFFF